MELLFSHIPLPDPKGAAPNKRKVIELDTIDRIEIKQRVSIKLEMSDNQSQE